MPAFDIDSQSPGGSFDPEPADHWSMPVGAIAGIRLYLSYSIPVALAVLAGVVAMFQHQEGNRDLPLVATTAVAIWGFGWIVQSIVQLCMHFATPAKSDSLTIGLLGVEYGNPLRRAVPWTSMSNLFASVMTLTALVVFGAGCLVIHMIKEVDDLSRWASWASELATPSFGLDAVENCYLTATWLFWIQAACQAYPLPKNMGRGAIASAIALFADELSEESQVRLVRRVLRMIAVMTFVIAIAAMLADPGVPIPRWPILMVVALLLWVSTASHDLADWVASVHVADAELLTVATDQDGAANRPTHAESRSATPWISEMIDSVRLRQKRKLAREALRREHEEANDQARLDHVLKTVSERGTDGLDPADKELLRRVSENLRRRRESEPDDS